MDAIVFDFDGVLVDSEPTHFACFKEVLAGEGVGLTSEQYYSDYLGFDDLECFRLALVRAGRPAGQDEIRRLVSLKTRCVQRHYAQSVRLMPGAMELLQAVRVAGIPLAVCSGGLPQEIELSSKTAGIWDSFMTVVSAQDVLHGKPDPEGYREAISRLCRLTGRVLRADQSLAIEDSPAGVAAAKSAGLKVLAVTTSRPAGELSQADRVITGLDVADIADLEALLTR